MDMRAELIAPYGMNCRLCLAFQRDKKPCMGCRNDEVLKPTSRANCFIKNCTALRENETGYCYDCSKFPRPRLKQLDTRYRTKYHMSMIENLQQIRDTGAQSFKSSKKPLDVSPVRQRSLRSQSSLSYL